MDKVKNITVQGSTGSIGVSTLEVISKFNDRFRVFSLVAGENVSLLAEQVREFQPEVVSVKGSVEAEKLEHLLGPGRTRIVWGDVGIKEATLSNKVDIVLAGASGISCLGSVLMALKMGKRVALANKELLVTAGELLMESAAKSGAEIIPVDSEHSAIFQAIRGFDRSSVRKIILTASGGPFYFDRDMDLSEVTAGEAIKHPVWDMGAKISVDSATMMNKGYELIEAMHLFNIPPEKIEVVIHPQSVIHSMVEFIDGSVLAQLGVPDMKIPIAFGLSFPERLDLGLRVDFKEELSGLTFFPRDDERFPSLSLASHVASKGGLLPAAMCGANDKAVEMFLEGKIKFTDIQDVVKRVVSHFEKGWDGGETCSPSKIEETISLSTNLTVKILEKIRQGA